MAIGDEAFMKLARETYNERHAPKKRVGRPLKPRTSIDNSSWTRKTVLPGRPREYDDKRINVLIRVSPELHLRIRKNAVMENRSMNNLIVRVLSDALPEIEVRTES